MPGPIDFQLLFEAVPGQFAVVLPDRPQFTVIAASDAFLRSAQRSRQDLIGQSLYEAFAATHPSQVATMENLRASFERVLSTKQADTLPVQQYDLPDPQHGGMQERYWSPANSPVLNGDGSVRYIFHRVEDVTEFVRLKRIEEAQGRLADAERVRAEQMEGQLFLRSRELAEIKRAEETLRSQWRAFDAALSHTPDFAYTFNLEGRFTYINHALLSLWNLPLHEAVGKNFFELDYPPELAGRLQRQIQEVIATKRMVRDHTPYTGASGNTGHYEYILVPIFDADGTVQGVAGSTRDITERKTSEDALRESEARFSAAFRYAPVGMVLTTPDGHFIEANPVYLEMLGYSRDELASGSSAAFTHPDDVPATIEYCRKLAEKESGTVGLEKRYFRKNGELVWVRASGTMLRDANGTAKQLIAIVEDITQRKRAEEALRHSEERLQQTFAQAPVAICVLRGRNLVFELANPHYERLFPGRSMMGKPLLDAIPEVRGELIDILHAVLDTGVPFVADEYKVPLDRDGDGVLEDYWFNFVYHPLRDHDQTVSAVVTVVVDVSHQVRTRQGLERANRELEEFAYVASHDLQEPLRMVNIYSQLLLRNLGDQITAELEQYAGFVGTGVRRMEALIRDLLIYSQTNHLEKTEESEDWADLDSALRHALTLVDSRVRETGAIVTADPLPPVAGNEGQWAHVFQNLLSNSIKYRQPGTVPHIHVGCQRQDGRWLMTVKDNGIGFHQEHAQRIFGLFKRLHREEQYPGTGLGLAICKRIVERYQGEMWAESVPGEGATFYISMPEITHE